MPWLPQNLIEEFHQRCNYADFPETRRTTSLDDDSDESDNSSDESSTDSDSSSGISDEVSYHWTFGETPMKPIPPFNLDHVTDVYYWYHDDYSPYYDSYEIVGRLRVGSDRLFFFVSVSHDTSRCYDAGNIWYARDWENLYWFGLAEEQRERLGRFSSKVVKQTQSLTDVSILTIDRRKV